jgi:HEPN domain-containing protein
MSLNKGKVVKYWIESSKDDYKTMLNLFSSKDFSWSLFMGHIVIEKLIKALYVMNKNETPPFIHDLLRLIRKTGIELDDKKMDALDEITTFNIKSRYDDYKDNFREICTKDFTEEKIKMIEEIRKWLMRILSE